MHEKTRSSGGAARQPWWRQALDPACGVPSVRSGVQRPLFMVVAILHVFCLVAVLWGLAGLTMQKQEVEALGAWGSIASIYGLVSVVSGIIILWSSIRSEAFAQASYDIAKTAIRAQAVQFSSFMEHIRWLQNKIPPSQELDLHLHISVSTPVFGILAGDSLGSAEAYIDWLEDWVAVLCRADRVSNPARPQVTMCVWAPDVHREQFRSRFLAVYNEAALRPTVDSLLSRWASAIGAFMAADARGHLLLRLHYSASNDTRWFMVRTPNYVSGLMAIFSPLARANLANNMWTIAGISFSDQESMNRLFPSYENLTKSYDSGAGVGADMKADIRDPIAWIRKYYEIPHSAGAGAAVAQTSP